MKRKGPTPEPGEPLDKARERLRQFELERGIEEEPSGEETGEEKKQKEEEKKKEEAGVNKKGEPKKPEECGEAESTGSPGDVPREQGRD